MTNASAAARLTVGKEICSILRYIIWIAPAARPPPLLLRK